MYDAWSNDPPDVANRLFRDDHWLLDKAVDLVQIGAQ